MLHKIYMALRSLWSFFDNGGHTKQTMSHCLLYPIISSCRISVFSSILSRRKRCHAFWRNPPHEQIIDDVPLSLDIFLTSPLGMCFEGGYGWPISQTFSMLFSPNSAIPILPNLQQNLNYSSSTWLKGSIHWNSKYSPNNKQNFNLVLCYTITWI